jgi:hypothetical protein
MVAEGKVSPAEADEVLGALMVPPAAVFAPPPPPFKAPMENGQSTKRRLRIQVREENEGDRNIQVWIPAGLTRAQQEFLIRQVRKPLEEQGVDLMELLEDIDQWPSGTTLFNLSHNDVHIDIRVEDYR